MTPKQREALDFITAHIETYGHSPSYDEIKAALGLRSKAGVARVIDALVDYGKLRRARYRARSLEPVTGRADALCKDIREVIGECRAGRMSEGLALDRIEMVVGR